jgi:lysophospholipase L1-like esterase
MKHKIFFFSIIMKHKIFFGIFLILLILGSGCYLGYYLYQESIKRTIIVDITISTIGDSLTDARHYGDTMEYGELMDNWYQYYTYQYLKTRNVESQIRNLGISGQTVEQICDRLNQTIPAEYIVSMAGTNNIWRADYTNQQIVGNLSQKIIETYNQTIFNTIDTQIAQGYFAPILIICSVPPVGEVNTLPEMMASTIQLVNIDLQAFVENLNRSDVLFCDVYRHMRNRDGYMIEGLFTDGVHFTKMGNKVCGEAIAQVIVDHHYNF